MATPRFAATYVVLCRSSGQDNLIEGELRLILVARSRVARDTGYRVLLLQRSPTNYVRPGIHVFPGGLVDSFDSYKHWQTIVGKPTSSSCESIPFKIAAIRETFEECGLLLASADQKVAQELSTWRQKENSDRSSFHKMCLELKLVPALSNLYAWSNWITPAFEPRRFNTRFYLSILSTPLEDTSIKVDGTELSSYSWWTPKEAIHQFFERNIKILPPQFYCLNELCSMPTLEELLTEATDRELAQVDVGPSIEPEFYPRAEGSMVCALPGDVLYSKTKPMSSTARHRIYIDYTLPTIMKVEKEDVVFPIPRS